MTDLSITYKRCPTCKQVRTTNDFSANKTRNDGLAVQCKECVKTYQKRRRAEIRAKVDMYDRAQKVLEQKRLAAEYAKQQNTN